MSLMLKLVLLIFIKIKEVFELDFFIINSYNILCNKILSVGVFSYTKFNLVLKHTNKYCFFSITFLYIRFYFLGGIVVMFQYFSELRT